jgi:hypothetical protein
MTRTEGYARARVIIGLIGGVLGLVIVARTVASVGFDWKALPAYVLGAALVALGITRWREYQAGKSM